MKRYPTASDPKKVGKYPALAGAGGGYVWDEVLEYRVWCQVKGESDCFQREYISEEEAGKYVHIKKPRRTEWPVEFLSRPRRKKNTIPDFFAPDAPANRVDILRGLACLEGAIDAVRHRESLFRSIYATLDDAGRWGACAISATRKRTPDEGRRQFRWDAVLSNSNRRGGHSNRGARHPRRRIDGSYTAGPG
jgi:hypothetical protein